MQLLTENYWFKLWRTPWGTDFLDSKLRWFGLELPLPDNHPGVSLTTLADRFLQDFHSADPTTQNQLESAFQFYPYELTADIEKILTTIATTDAPRAQRMRTNLFTAESDLPEDYRKFTRALSEHLQNQSIPHTLIGDNPFFSVFLNDGGLHIETKVESIYLMPQPEQIAALTAPATTLTGLAYQRAIQLVKENMWLLEPQPGASAIPSTLIDPME